MGEVRNGDQKVREYLFPEIFYGRQEVHKYFCTSVNINGRFTSYIIPRLLHIKNVRTDRQWLLPNNVNRQKMNPPIITPVIFLFFYKWNAW